MSRRRREKAAFGAAIVSATLLGCQLVGGIDVFDLTSKPEDATADADADIAEGGASGSSCIGLAATCRGNQDCCASNVVVGGTFKRSNSGAFPATVSDFKLDVYEVTVGRFRAFVNAGKGTQTSPPARGDGAHPKIASSGWDSSFDRSLAATTSALRAALKCGTFPAWTEVPNPNADETLPINCVTWFEAFAFCAWDGGRLPTEAEWEYAAAGGDEQRDYPWGSGIDTTKASYDCGGNGSDGGTCAFKNLLPVGSKSPQGDGKWGQADLAGNVWEWSLDWYRNPYRLTTCRDCADLQTATSRVFRGAGFINTAPFLLASRRPPISGTPMVRSEDLGIRCAKAP